MFNPHLLLNHFRARLAAPDAFGPGPCPVNPGNEPVRSAGKPVRFDIAAAPGDEIPFTEGTERRVWTVTLTAAAVPGTGLARLLDAAHRAAWLYAPFDSKRGAFRLGRTRFFVTGVTVGAPRFENGAARAAVTYSLISETPR